MTPRIPTLALAAALSAAAIPAYAQSAGPPPAPSTATQTVDIMNRLWGKNPGMRANHAKGVVAEGMFVPSKAGPALSKASIFAGAPVPVTVRFSDSTGLPTLSDGSTDANPHGMSIKFKLAEGGEMDVVTNSLAFFPVATGEDFRDLLQAITESPQDAPHPNKLEQFVGTHPAVPKAFGSAASPSSFAREAYNGVDAFVFVNAAGQRQAFRFKFVPVAGIQHIAPGVAAKMKPNYLMDDLPKRLATGKVSFRVTAQLAGPGDATKDPTIPWPPTRKMVDLGTITLSKAVPDQEAAQKALRYLPNRLASGIEVSDDPLIDARVRAYVVSFGRRAH